MTAFTEQPVALPDDIPDILTKAGYVLASRIPRSKHGQLCPVWMRRARNADISRCDCWILRHAMDDARTVAEVLLPTEGAQP